jgi:predicted XRE-type DNA-binding protein
MIWTPHIDTGQPGLGLKSDLSLYHPPRLPAALIVNSVLMKTSTSNKPAHIVKGDIFDALGFTASEATSLKVKAEILSSILDPIRNKGYSQSQLAEILDEHQPSVSNLLRGRISQVSIEKLLRYADRLHLAVSMTISAKRPRVSRARPSAVLPPRAKSRARVQATTV